MLRVSRFIPFVRFSAARLSSQATTVNSDSAKSDAFRDWYHLPDFRKLDPETITDAVQKVIADCERDLHLLEQTKVSRWEDLFTTLDSIDDRFSKTATLVSHLGAVNDSPVIRKHTEVIQPQLVAFTSRMAQSKPLFEHYQTVRK